MVGSRLRAIMIGNGLLRLQWLNDLWFALQARYVGDVLLRFCVFRELLFLLFRQLLVLL